MSILEQLVKELAQVQKHSSPAGAHVGPNARGPNSLFGVPGLDRDVISARVTATGLAGILPAVGSRTDYPLFPFITGKTAPTGSQQTNACADAPTAGNLKTCIQTAQFGLYMFATRELELNTIGRLINAGETIDLRFVNDPLASQLGAIFPNITDKDMALQVGREVLMRFVEVGMDFQELLSQQLYTGTGNANEFPGLEILVTTTHYDAKTGQVCTALESDVRDFGDVDIATAAGSASIVDTLVSMYRNAKHNASTMGFNPVEFAFVMREQLFTEITDVWPCSYLTSRCLPRNSNVSINVNTDGQIALRNEMRQGKYLLVDGEKVVVVVDDWMAQTQLNPNLFSSDIYLLPMTVKGGRNVLFWEYVNYAETVAPSLIDGRLSSEFWTDGGRYLWVKKPQVNFCVMWQSKIEPRVRLETPQLAARLQNVAVTLSKVWRSPVVGDDYYLNGGVSTGRALPTPLYNEWNSTP